MSARRIACACCVVQLLTGGSPALAQRPKPITVESLSAITAWTNAVIQHKPGVGDASVEQVASLTYQAREQLYAGMGLFLRSLLGLPAVYGDNDAAAAIAELGRNAGAVTAPVFLKKAAMLHSDAAVYLANVRGRLAATDTTAGGGPPLRRGPPPAVPLLLVQNRVTVGLDGQVMGDVVAVWHWPFARGLLDLVSRENSGRIDPILAGVGGARPASDPFVSMWYHATAAGLFASAAYGELAPHLQHASEILPNDALLLFDRGCYAEALGLPFLQTMVSEIEVIERRRAGMRRGPAGPPRVAVSRLGIPEEASTNTEAEQRYREALSIDPSLIEARVRLARLLSVRGQAEAASAELATALKANSAGAIAYYTQMFAGRAAQSLGRLDAAAAHYQAARSLYPDAQSAAIAASQLALIRADVDGALAPITGLATGAPETIADPWWVYHRCAGRDVDMLLRKLWATFDTAARRERY